jgi:uncharacterized membrane protein YvbJ
MFCYRCGAQNDDNAWKCTRCGEVLQRTSVPGAPGAAMEAIPNHLVQAILTTIFCCLPFGIVAIVYAAQVNPWIHGGNAEAAMNASRKARMWAWLAFGIGLLWIVLYASAMVIIGIVDSQAGRF